MLTIQQNRAEKNVIPLVKESALPLRFPGGLLGFEEIKEYKIHPFPDLHPFLWLEGQSNAGQCFLVISPSYAVESYQIELSDEDVEFLELKEPEDAVVLNIATFFPDGSITVNLKGPVIYNRHTLTARQVIPKNAAALPINHPISN
jgi:flagellar assembly factor FliW